MTKLNKKRSTGIIKGCEGMRQSLENMYISKRFLVDDGMPEEAIDRFIEEKCQASEERYSSMTKDEYTDYLFNQRVHIRSGEAEEEAYNELSTYGGEQCPELLRIMHTMLWQIEEEADMVMLMRRGTIILGADPDELAMAMADTTKEINDHYMSITEEELEEAVAQKMRQAMERMQPN